MYSWNTDLYAFVSGNDFTQEMLAQDEASRKVELTQKRKALTLVGIAGTVIELCATVGAIDKTGNDCFSCSACIVFSISICFLSSCVRSDCSSTGQPLLASECPPRHNIGAYE